MVVVYKGGLNIIQLVNKESPQSGRSICVEINSCRNEFIRTIQSAKVEAPPWLSIAIGVGVFVLVTIKIVKLCERR